MEDDHGPNALERLLADSAQAGKVDSEGCFTIDYAAARSKLAGFQLPDSSFYLLKVLQAAYWGKASRVDMTLERRAAQFRFVDWAPKVEDIVNKLSHPELRDSGEPCQALAVGLQSLLAQGATLALQLPGLDRDNLLVLSDKLEWRTAGTVPEVFSVTVQWSKESSRTLKGNEQVLKERCFCYPLELTLNGQSLKDRPSFWPFETELGHHLPGSKTLAEAPVSEDGPVKHILLRASLQSDARISLVRGGVVSDVVLKPIDVPGLDILIDAEELATDLTGLQVRQDSEFENLMSHVSFDAKLLKSQASETIRSLSVSTVPPRFGHLNQGFGCVVGIGLLYLILRVQVYLITNVGSLAACLAVAGLLVLFYKGFNKADQMGFNFSHAPEGFEAQLIKDMLNKLN